MGRRGSWLGALFCALVAVMGFAGAASAADTVTIQARDDVPGGRWVPPAVTIKPGDTVRWSFSEAVAPHNVKSDSPNWNFTSPTRNPADPPVEHKFDAPGVYAFLCELHPTTMKGSVTVQDEPAADPLEKILVFSKTAGFRHDSIPSGIAALQQLGAANDFEVTASEDATVFTDANLAQFDAVVFLSTTGDILNAEQQAAFERYIQAGNGFVGIHAASDTEYTWPWYGQLVGGYFKSHPPGTPTATVRVEDGNEPSTTGIPASWVRTDEWYNFQSPVNPVVNGGGTDYSPRNSGVHVLATVDESTYNEQDDNATDDDHPVSWCTQYDGGIAWYTAMGHTQASFSEPDFRKHLLGGLQTATRAATSDCGAARQAPPSSNDFEIVTIDDDTESPMELDIAADGRVFYVERVTGEINVWNPATGQVTTAVRVPVDANLENGLMGIQLAPDFESSRHLYVTYTPIIQQGQEATARTRVSRFTVAPNNTIALSSEQVIYSWEAQRERCCHSSGSLAFGLDGSLFIGTGDNTNPFESSGFTPIDEQPGRRTFDAQRTSANTNNANGKILRIKPIPGATGVEGLGTTYTIPEGNLFPEAQDTQNKTLPEIYAMGFRNPFRLTVDPKTGNVLMGDYGPDAGQTNANRGPQGSVEFNVVTPGNYGWPYCVRDNVPYNDYNFATSTSGAKFNCAAPVNNSPNNTGLTNLPPAKPAVMWMGYSETDARHPNLGTGGAPTGGPRYDFDSANTSPTKFPEYFDGHWFIGEWNNGWIKTATLNDAGTVTSVNSTPWMNTFKRPHEIEFGPDGSLYVIDWGSGFGGNNLDSGIFRIDYVKGARRPIAQASATPDSGPTPLQVTFSSAGSIDPDQTALTYEWDFNSDGTVDSTEPNPTFTFNTAGAYDVLLRVTDADRQIGTDTVRVVVGNTRPTVRIVLPDDGQFADFGDVIPYEIQVTDPEDTTIDCTKVTLSIQLGHDDHAHGLGQRTGCTGTFETETDGGHGATANIFTSLVATYTDTGTGPAGSLTGQDEAIVHPRRKRAEFFDSTGRAPGGSTGGDPGVQQETTADAGGGENIGFIEHGDYIAFERVNLEELRALRFRVASAGTGGTIQVRLDSPGGQLVGETANIAPTGGWQNWSTVELPLANPPEGTHTLFIVFNNPAAGANSLMNLNWFEAVGRGAAASEAPTVTTTATPASGQAPLEVKFEAQATDPDGAAGQTLTYRWDFGVPGTTTDTSTQEDPTYTYERAGTYTARLTVTDATGARATSVKEVRVTAPPTNGCPQDNLRSDEFEGSSLDSARWTVIRPDNADPFTVSGGNLRLPIANGSIYANGTSAKNIIVQPLPDGNVEVTAKITTEPLTENYHQAGLRVYSDDDNWASVHMIHAGGSRDIEFIAETNGNPRNEAADKAGGLPATASHSYYVRLRSNGDQLTASYSFDGDTFTPVGRPASLATFTNPRVGPTALSDAAPTKPMASFDWIRFDPDNASGGGGGGGGTPNTTTDNFDGADLGSAWEVVRRNQLLTVANGALRIPAAPGDLYGGRNDAANLVTRAAPAGPWTATTKMNFEGSAAYQQAGIMVYGDDQNFTKFGRIATNGTDEKFEFIYENAGSPRNETADSTANLPGTFPKDFWVRMTSDGTNVTGEYSTDGTTWTAVGRPAPLPANAKIGLFAFSNDGTGNPVAAFDSFSLTTQSGGGGGEPSGPSRDDEFEGSTLDKSRWNAIVREDASAYSTAGGKLTITTQPGDIYTGDSNPLPNNFILQDAANAGADWTIETRMSGTINGGWAQGGLLAYKDSNNYVKFDPISDDGGTRINRIELRSEVGGQIANPQPNIDVPAGTTAISLRLTKAGNTYSGEYSFDGTTWVAVPESVTNAMEAPDFGLYAFGPLAAGQGDTVSFDYFWLNGQDAPGGCECVAGPGDEFDSSSLDKSRWNAIVREDASAYSMSGGKLTITTQAGDIYTGDSNPPPNNFILQKAANAGADWVIETKMSGTINGGYAQGGLMAYKDGNNYVKFDPISDDGNTRINRIELRSEVGGQITNPTPEVTNVPAGTTEVWLRLTKAGNTYSGEYSYDGTTWVAMSAPVTNAMEAPDFGLFAFGPLAAGVGDTVSFDYFKVNGSTGCPSEEPDNTAPVVATATATPDSGFAPLAVSFAATATDADGDQLSYSWDFNGDGTEDSNVRTPSHTYAAGGTYTARVTVTDGKGGRATRTVSVNVLGAEQPGARFRTLVFSKTAGFRHSSIDEGIAAIRKLGTENNFQVDATEDASLFRDDVLSKYDTVVFLSTTGDVLNDTQQAAFERYIKAGGGYTGIHAASDTEYTWPWYGQLVGAYFRNHPQNQTATVRVEDQEHPATAGLPASYPKLDEWYNFQSPMNPNVGGGGADYTPRPNVHVLANVDESTYDEADGTAAADDHPVTWCQRYDGGRSFYTAMGHTEQSYTEPEFLKQVLGGLETTAGVKPSADCGRQADPAGKPVIQAFADPASGPAPLATTLSVTGVDPDGGALSYKWTFSDGTAFGASVSRTFRTAGTHTATVTATDNEGDTATATVQIVVGGAANQAPTVTASANRTSGPAELRVRFDATGTDPDGDSEDLVYHWDFGDDNGTSLEASPEHTYMEPGTYVARVTVTDAGGASATRDITITVTNPPGNVNPSVQAAAMPASGDAPLDVVFTADGTDPDGNGNALTYSWAFGDGGTGTGRTASHRYTRAGTFEAVVTATDPRGGTATAKVTVVVGNPRGNQAPTVQIAATPLRGTAPMRVAFSAAANDPDGDAVLYEWDFGDGGKAGGRTASHTYTRAGTYTAKVTVDDLKGGKTTAQVTITVAARGAVQVLGVSQATRTVSLKSFTSRGLKARVTCSTTGTAKASLAVSKATARKLGLRTATLASASVKCASGKRVTVRVKPSKAMVRRLSASKAKSLKATFGVSVKGKTTAKQTVTFRR